MFKIPSVIGFVLSAVLGMYLAVTSESWFGAWVGLELNLLSFIPVIMVGGQSGSVEAGLKYFLIQACGSLLVLQMGVVVSFLNYFFMGGVVLALVLKAGGAPFHFWLPMVVEGLSWSKVILLSSVQKLAPLTLLSYSLFWDKFIGFIVLASVWVGTVGGINEMHLRKLFAFSAISHFGWMCMGMLSGEVWFMYFLIYCLMIVSLMAVFKGRQLFHLMEMNSESSSFRLTMGLSLMSLGGVPPLLGFLPKWMVISQSSGGLELSLVSFGVIMSLVSLFYYLRAGIVFYLSGSVNLKSIQSSKFTWGELSVLTVNLLGFIPGGILWSLWH